MRALIVGDSVVGGFGKGNHRSSFLHQALNKAEIEYVDLSCPGITSDEFIQVLEKKIQPLCKEQADGLAQITSLAKFELVFISLGNVDGKKNFQMKNSLYKLIPLRYLRNDGKLDERPYYSSKFFKYFITRSENYARRLIKRYLDRTGNLNFPISINDFKANINMLNERFQGSKVIFISTSKISNRFFPESVEYFKSINHFLKITADGTSAKAYFDLYSLVSDDVLLLDRFHLTEEGHRIIADHFEAFLRKTL